MTADGSIRWSVLIALKLIKRNEPLRHSVESIAARQQYSIPATDFKA